MSYVFKVGDKGKTKDGRPYEILGVGKQRLLVGFYPHGREPYYAETSIGLDGDWEGISHSPYLLPPTRKLEGWLNIFDFPPSGVDSVRGPYPTKEEAYRVKGNVLPPCKWVACVKVSQEYTPGEGLDSE